MMPTSKRKPVNEDSIEVWRLRAFDAPDPALIEEELEEEVGEKVVLPTAEEIEAMALAHFPAGITASGRAQAVPADAS
jgi:hypothetical protein